MKDLANHEIVTLAVFPLGGVTSNVDTEDVAIKANEIAPGRFTWRKYPEQINIDTVRKRLPIPHRSGSLGVSALSLSVSRPATFN
jgi:hypothetical protein